jgi:hypothetical protein
MQRRLPPVFRFPLSLKVNQEAERGLGGFSGRSPVWDLAAYEARPKMPVAYQMPLEPRFISYP